MNNRSSEYPTMTVHRKASTMRARHHLHTVEGDFRNIGPVDVKGLLRDLHIPIRPADAPARPPEGGYKTPARFEAFSLRERAVLANRALFRGRHDVVEVEEGIKNGSLSRSMPFVMEQWIKGKVRFPEAGPVAAAAKPAGPERKPWHDMPVETRAAILRRTYPQIFGRHDVGAIARFLEKGGDDAHQAEFARRWEKGELDS